MKLQCPHCQELAGVYILYGLPSMDTMLFEQVKNKEIVLGGCIIRDVTHECTSCNYKWKVEDPD